MRDKKDHATLELPGFETAAPMALKGKRPAASRMGTAGSGQEQLELLAATDTSGLPLWRRDTDSTGLPIWLPA